MNPENTFYNKGDYGGMPAVAGNGSFGYGHQQQQMPTPGYHYPPVMPQPSVAPAPQPIVVNNVSQQQQQQQQKQGIMQPAVMHTTMRKIVSNTILLRVVSFHQWKLVDSVFMT